MKTYEITVSFSKGKETKYLLPDKPSVEQAIADMVLVWYADFQKEKFQIVKVEEQK